MGAKDRGVYPFYIDHPWVHGLVECEEDMEALRVQLAQWIEDDPVWLCQWMGGVDLRRQSHESAKGIMLACRRSLASPTLLIPHFGPGPRFGGVTLFEHLTGERVVLRGVALSPLPYGRSWRERAWEALSMLMTPFMALLVRR